MAVEDNGLPDHAIPLVDTEPKRERRRKPFDLGERKPAVHGYARASTRRQEASPETQKEQIIAYCHMNNLGDDITFYVDPHTSGKIRWDDRQGGRALFGRLRPGDHVVIPVDTAHAVHVTGDGPARGLVVASPSGFARLISQVGMPDDGNGVPPSMPTDMDLLRCVSAELGDEILGPPGALPE